MFEVRDRKPTPNLVPWAGEFAGKFLISAVQAMRMDASGNVRQMTASVVERLIKTQDEDGYLGPFRKEERLLRHWDLWGHYHCMLGLLMWHEATDDVNALGAAQKIGDLVCKTFLDSEKRAFDAGSDEMNLAIIHSLGWLYRITKEERYLRMMREIEKDWERGGDYLRAGLDGTEFFQTKRPRWESLHNLQGLVELYRITGEGKYRDAFEHHWRSIARWDLRNTGGFSSGEQATGNPYSPTPIETCCTIAWMALSLDMLMLDGDSKVADLLELATFNAWGGAQHPSGRWCTYNTPMDGIREASAHTIVFQSRHGTPELNCCSVNGPRGWGMLSEWAFTRSEDGYVINWLAPGSAIFTEILTNSTAAPLAASGVERKERIFWISGEYPRNGEVEIRLELPFEEEFTLRIRIPEWSTKNRAWLNDEELSAPVAGTYLTLRRKWQSHWRKGDVIKLAFDMTPRVVPGAREAAGKVSVYRGPILLAADQRFNSFDEVPLMNPAAFAKLQLEAPARTSNAWSILDPLLVVRAAGATGETIRLCDFASAGATGTRYQSWLPVTNAPPAPVQMRIPLDSAVIPTGKKVFRWTRAETNSAQFLEIARDSSFRGGAIVELPVSGRAAVVSIAADLAGGEWLYWRVVSSNEFGITPSTGPFARFRVDASLPAADEEIPAAPLAKVITHPDRLSFDGTQKKLFELEEWPEEDFSVSFRFRLRSHPGNRMAQLFSGWAAAMDDPLRVTIQDGKLSARMEAGAAYSTPAVPIEPGKWHEVSVRKQGAKLSLTLDGKERGSCTVPMFMITRAKNFALGGNPHFNGNEFVDAEIEGLVFKAE